MDADRVFIYEFEKGKEEAIGDQNSRLRRISRKYVFVQTALLYSTSEGQRRIRCHTMAVPLTNSVNECYDHLDIAAVSALLMRKALNRFSKMAVTETCRSIIEAGLNNLCKAVHRHAKLS